MSSFLPDGIIVDILSKLPVKSILRFRCVCKPWCNLISNPNFVKIHLINHAIVKEKFNILLKDYNHLYSMEYYDSSSSNTCYEAVEIDYPFKSQEYPVEIFGSCNGLLCINPPGPGCNICLWNPSTKEYKEIPSPHDQFDINNFLGYAYGFGYDCNIDDYKLVRVICLYGASSDDDDEEVFYGCEVQVYTLGSNSWKHIPFIYPHELFVSPGVLVNGALHWRATLCKGGSKATDVLASFDIGDERFEEISLPLVHLDDMLFITVGALGGCLCIFDETSSLGIDVWVMKDYGVWESWTKLFTIAQQSLVGSVGSMSNLRPIRSFMNGEIILNVGLDECMDALVLYDAKHERVRILKIHGGGQWGEAATYVESLVSLYTGMYVCQERIEEAIKNTKKVKKRNKRKNKNKKKAG
ncbi:F-box domain [Macleaya cordata]|uniref:F-box domain n=1 Tax=Macleaya cordata TaxID=56857 RepID=A0A200RDS2_MACCD|nr:F-box domain [Macleaya cordata]